MLLFSHNNARELYSDVREPFTGNVDFHSLDAVKGYLRHYGNKLYLGFMLANGTRIEKQQASKELEICERKLTWWQRHPNFDRDQALRGAEALKRDWAK